MKLGWPWWWMVWNLALAVIPVILSILFFKREDQPRHVIRNITFGFEVALVLLILPNAPYVATDLVHFLEVVRTGDASLWKLLGTELPIYVLYVFIGLTCYSFTVDRLIYALRMRLGRGWGWAGLFGIPLLSSLGIYLGRVARYNSWNVLTDPQGIIHRARNRPTENSKGAHRHVVWADTRSSDLPDVSRWYSGTAKIGRAFLEAFVVCHFA